MSLPDVSPRAPELAHDLTSLHAGVLPAERFFALHLTAVRRLVRRACAQVGVTALEDVEDATQETCARLVDRGTRRFRGGSAAGFIVGVAKNAAGATTRRRRSRLLTAANGGDCLWGAGGRGVSNGPPPIEAVVMANEVLERLDPEALELVLMSYTLGVTTREAATLFGRSPAWVCRRLEAARDHVAALSA